MNMNTNMNVNREDKFNVNEYIKGEMNVRNLELCEDYYCVLGWRIIDIIRSKGERKMKLQCKINSGSCEKSGLIQKNCEGEIQLIENIEGSKRFDIVNLIAALGVLLPFSYL